MSSPRFTLVITGRRALEFAPRCLESVRWQVGVHAERVIYVDDASSYPAGRLQRLADMVESAGGELLTHATRRWQLGSIAHAMSLIDDPGTVVCLLDGDDWLLPHALRTVAEAYTDPDVALTWGNTLVDFRPFQDPLTDYFGPDKRLVNTPYPDHVWATRSFRADGFRCFHLRTFRRWLWDFIDPVHLRMPDGAPFRGSGDSAVMYPMLEMLAEPRHVRFIEDPIYVYRLHDGQVHHLDKAGQHEGLETLRFAMAPYPPLDRARLRHLLRSHR